MTKLIQSLKAFALAAAALFLIDTLAAAAEETDLSEKQGSFTGFFVQYLNAHHLGRYFLITEIAHTGAMAVSFSGDVQYSAEITLPNAQEPTFELFIHGGPIRLFIPDINFTASSKSNWEYKECSYRVVELYTNEGRVLSSLKDLTSDNFQDILIEARCGERKDNIARYFIGVGRGLLSFSFGEVIPCAQAEGCFSPQHTYFLAPNGCFGLGATANPKRPPCELYKR